MVRTERVVGVAVALGQLDSDEPIAQPLAQEGEALGRDEAIALEAQTKHAQPRGAAVGDDVEVGGVAVDGRLAARRRSERQRRLRQDGRDDPLVDGHGQREPAGEAHADGADARPPAPFVLTRRQCS